jgi:predicted outer membrane repeat protein
MNKNIARIIVLTLTLFLLLITSFTGWVQANPNSWADACDLQAALTTAVATNEIWVEAGTYKPTTTTNRTISFVLKNGVGIYGGFAGTETALDQRDWAGNPTILSGDIGVTGDNSENSYHVVYGTALSATTILDGFTITAGNANSNSGNQNNSGGGLFNDTNSSPMLSNLTFSANSAGFGGGMFNFNHSSPTLNEVTFSENSAYIGGGIDSYFYSNPTLTNVTFSGNTATDGGGMYNENNCSPILTNVTFLSNSSASWGGGMYNTNSNPTLTAVTFSDNLANYGGGMFNDNNSSPTLTNVTFSTNSARYEGTMTLIAALRWPMSPLLLISQCMAVVG